MNFENVTAIVTGGSSGLGAATVETLTQAGAHCMILDVNEGQGSALAARLGSRACFINADVTNENQVTQALNSIQGPPLRVLVNCAFFGTLAPIINGEHLPHDLALFQRVVNVTLVGTFNVTRLVAAHMSKNEPDEDGGRGVIINVASLAATDGQAGQAAYAASKAGVIGLMLPAVRDLAPFGIRVMTIAPGTFGTPAVMGLPKNIRNDLAAAAQFPPRLGRPEEFGHLVKHICENSFLNGEVIRLSAGAVLPPR